jgi:hypothetical protein
MEPRFIAAEQWSGKRGGGAPPAAPSITSVTPNTGAATDEVTFAGTGFSGGNAVFKLVEDDREFTDVVVNSDIEATGLVPGSPAAEYDVSVTTDGGTDTLTDGFTVTA